MAMTATAVRFAPEEREWIQAFADFSGKTFSEVVRESTLAAVEDAADIEAYREALAADDGTRLSMEEVMRLALEAE